MTREEAIDIIKKYDVNGCGYCHQGGNEVEEAFNMAIKALEYDDAKYHAEHGEVIVDKAVWEDAKRALEQEQKWIPVSERMPKIAGIYRVTRYYPNNVMNPNYLVDACCFDGSNTWYDDNRINYDRAYADNVIAWQENPEPYKVEPQESEEV